jgi:hypothetical protein
MLPVNLLDYEQVCRVNVNTFRAAEAGRLAAIRILSDDVVGNLGDAHDAMECPPLTSKGAPTKTWSRSVGWEFEIAPRLIN